MTFARVKRFCAAAGVGLVAAVALAVDAVPASAATTGPARPVVTMFSDRGDYIGGGAPQEFDWSNATFSGTLTSTGINLSVSGGTSGTNFSFVIDPPSGSSLGVGYFPGVQRAGFATGGHPGMDITGDGRGCNQDTGWFEVRDIAFAQTTVTRIDLLYEQHCEGSVPALFGQVQVAEPQTNKVIVSSSSVTWPPLGLGATATPAPVYVRNLGSTTVAVGAAHVAGTDASMFSVSGDQCSNQQLAPGASCLLFLGFTPSTHGPHAAFVSLPIDSVVRTVQLDGEVTPGATLLTMASQSGDYIGGGGSYKFTPGNAALRFSGGASGIELDVSAADGQTWTVDMFPASGRILTPGKFANATRYPFQGSGNGLSVFGDGRGCNTLTGSFTVKQAVYSAVDNSLQHFDATFIQHCEGAAPALTGEVKFDAAPVVTPPPNVTNAQASPAGTALQVTWSNPASSTGWQYTIVRVQQAGALGVAAFTGTEVSTGTNEFATISGLHTGAGYWVTFFTVDVFGNVSPAEVLRVTGP